MRPNRIAAALAAASLAVSFLAGCQGAGRSPGSPARAADPAEDGRVVFRGYSFTKDAAGSFVIVAQVRVRAASGSATRDYYVKAGEAIGRLEPDGDFRTGLVVDKIDKGQRPIPARIDGKDVTVLTESYYLLARGMGGQQVFWLASGRPATPGREAPR